MRILLFATIFIAFSFIKNNATAQFNYIGGGIALATGAEYKYEGYSYFNKSFGIDLRASYNYSKKIKIVPDFHIYLPNKKSFVTGGESKTTVFVFNLNIHYIVNPRSDIKLYILAGGHAGGWNIKDNHSSNFADVDINEFQFVPGANVGGGIQFKLGQRVQFFAEAKYVIAKANQLIFSPGLLYEF